MLALGGGAGGLARRPRMMGGIAGQLAGHGVLGAPIVAGGGGAPQMGGLAGGGPQPMGQDPRNAAFAQAVLQGTRQKMELAGGGGMPMGGPGGPVPQPVSQPWQGFEGNHPPDPRGQALGGLALARPKTPGQWGSRRPVSNRPPPRKRIRSGIASALGMGGPAY